MRVHAYCLKCEIVHLCHVIEESENDYLLKCDKDNETFSFTINKSHTTPEEEKQ